MKHFTNLELHNNRGEVLPDINWDYRYEEWKKSHPGEFVFGPIIKHTWKIDGKVFARLNPKNESLNSLPDFSGFLLCEKNPRVDNLVLLDVYGVERIRLAPPWEMTGVEFVEGGKEQVNFLGIASPWDNPATGEKGKFGVSTTSFDRWGGAYYFELDWLTGRFLWCYGLERG